RRRELPDEFGELAPVLLVSRAPALRGEIELIPPLELGLGWQRHLPCRMAADQITADRDEPLAAFGPEHRHDTGRARAPVTAAEDCRVDLERIHEGDRVDGERRWLAVPHRLTREKARRAIAAQIRDDYAIPLRRQ